MEKWRIPMNLQLFAADDGDAGSGAEGGEGGAGSGESGAKPVSFDDFLAEGTNKTEYESRVSKEVKKALAQAEKKWKALTDASVSEAEKLAMMNKDEKAEYQRQKKESDLAKREAELTKKELQSGAKSKLIDAGLPAELFAVLDYTDEEACDRSIETLQDTFQKAVEAAVEEKLKGTDPMGADPSKSGNNKNSTMDQQIYNAMKGW